MTVADQIAPPPVRGRHPLAYGLAGLGDPHKSAPSLLSTAADLDAALDGYRTEPVTATWREVLSAVRAPLQLAD